VGTSLEKKKPAGFNPSCYSKRQDIRLLPKQKPGLVISKMSANTNDEDSLCTIGRGDGMDVADVFVSSGGVKPVT
jgi:hypothetical protein